MSAIAWIALGGVLTALLILWWFGWRVSQAARSMADISLVVKRVADGAKPRPIDEYLDADDLAVMEEDRDV